MSQIDKIKDKFRQAVGYLKYKLGGTTGNRRMQAEGGKDMASGKAKETGHDAKHSFKKGAAEGKKPSRGKPGEKK